MTLLQKKFEELLASNTLEPLEAYSDAGQWHGLNSREKELLALLFVKQGEMSLRAGEGKALESFHLAAKAAPESAEVHLRMGLAYLQQPTNPTLLISGCRCFSRATELQPNLFEAWYRWAFALSQLGRINREMTYFQEALECFAKAGDLPDTAPAIFFAHWGQCWHASGTLSGEAVDFHAALEKYKEAAERGYEDADLYNDQGNVITELGFLIGRKELFFEAADSYQKAAVLDPLSPRGWSNLAFCNSRIFEVTGDPECYHDAVRYFEKATAFDRTSGALWSGWGQLIVCDGKLHRDVNRLQESFEKFEQADACDPDNPAILCRWAEALMLSGTNSENLDWLKAAEAKIKRAVAIAPTHAEACYIYGACLNELARYFADEELYLQAIEKFQEGIQLNQSDPLLWYGLALAHYSFAELTQSVLMVEKATRYYSRVLEFGGFPGPQFWNDWGVSLMKLAEMTNQKEHIEAAVEKFVHLMALHEEHPDAFLMEPDWLYNYGCALDFLGDFREEVACYEKAVEVLSKLVQSDPHYVHARYNLALALTHLGESASDLESLHRAHEHFQILLNQDPEDEMGWNDWGLALMNVADLIYDPARVEQSQKIFEVAESKLIQAAALGCVHSYYNLSCLHSMTGNLNMSLAFLEKAKVANALPALEDLIHDEWLENLKHTDDFRHFLTTISQQDKD